MVHCEDELGAAACVAHGAHQAAALSETAAPAPPPMDEQGMQDADEQDPLMAASIIEHDSPPSSAEGEPEAPLIRRGGAQNTPPRG